MIARQRRRQSRSPGSAATCPSACSRTPTSSKMVDTTDEWIIERTGIRERRIAAPDAGAVGPRASRGAASARAGRRRRRGHRPDRRRDGDAGHGVPVHRARSSPTSSARRTPPPTTSRRLHRLHVRARAGVRDARGRPRASARSSSAATCSRGSSTGRDRSTCVLFGDGAGAAVLERVDARRLPRLRARRGRRRRRATSGFPAAARARSTTSRAGSCR